MAGKLKAAGLLVLMFALGAVSGIAWQIHMFRHGAHHGAFAERRIARLKKELHLTAWQEDALKDIMQDARERAADMHDEVALDMAQIHEDSVDAINQMLTPDQQKTFEKIHEKHHRHDPGENRPPGPPEDHEPGAG